MGNSSGSAAVGAECTLRDCNKTPTDFLQKRRNESLQQRGTSCKFSRPKVLPDLGSPLRLRRTDNGDILHNGGTISARRQERNGFYGSEPDLRINGIGRESIYIHGKSSKLRASRCRKKYRAPKAPAVTLGSSSPDSYQEGEVRDEQVSRRTRLFKTRTESQKLGQDDFQHFPRYNHHPLLPSLQRSLSTPLFDGELLSSPQNEAPHQSSTANSLELRGSPRWKDDVFSQPPPGRITPMFGHSSDRLDINRSYDRASHQNDFFDGLRKQNDVRLTTKSTTPVRKFYFGMNSDKDLNESRTDDAFRSKLHLNQENIDGFLSLPCSDTVEVIDDEECQNGGINVQLRATLPRKQLDIPQFSPLTAWRLLSCSESLQRGDNSGNCEEELEVLSSSHNNHLHHHQHYHHVLLVDKSQDSGISADDSPRIDSQAAWTPQQDLEETSSDGGFSPFAPLPSENCQTARFSPRFMLSLPRDDRLNIYSNQAKDALGEKMRNVRDKCDDKGIPSKDRESSLIDSNWVLSRSMPSLLNATSFRPSQFSSVDVSIEETDLPSSLVKQPSLSYLANGGHIMYLPQYSKYRVNEKNGKAAPGNSSLSKSCEDVTAETASEIAQTSLDCSALPKAKSEKKFTFQSTIRQLERKRLADKLSKEAETKENERRLEVEAMRKAEEEFQRKREKEKVGIRQQLRLFSLSGNPTTTQVLSEFHIPSRDYKEYRYNKFPNERDSPKLGSHKKSTVHPEVTYQIPKSTQIYFNPRTNSGRETSSAVIGVDNYRKKFAQGGVIGSSVLPDTQAPSHLASYDSRGDSQIKFKGTSMSSKQSNRLSLKQDLLVSK